MQNLLGEYDCKMDAKGRFMFPNALKKQLGDAAIAEGFVFNRDIFESCLVLYPKTTWNKVSAQLGKLNRFIKKNALFIRRFNAGATLVELDNSGRVLIPKPLIEHASLTKEIKLVATGERIELWDKQAYLNTLNEDIDFAGLAEDVMGEINLDD